MINENVNEYNFESALKRLEEIAAALENGNAQLEDSLALFEEGVISGGMIPKVECCIDAIHSGVKKVFIIDGRIPHSILIETLTDEGIGTMFVDGTRK